MKKKGKISFIALITGMLLVAACSLSFVSMDLYAEEEHTAGQDLIVRIGYFGDDDDFREKAVLTNEQLSALNSQSNYYTNVTKVGTIMYMAAEGPTLADVIEAAGVDINSIQTIHIRTTDGVETDSRFISFPADSYLMTERYYYPNIYGNWERAESEDGGIPSEEGLSGAQAVDTILALRSYSTKDPREAKNISKLAEKMDTEYSYRLCAGQKELQANVKTTAAAITSSESAYWIFGIDLQLYGSPPENAKITGSLKNLKVGSQQTLHIDGTDFFGNKFKDGKVTWTSSNPEVATIGRSDGLLVIKSEGKTRITATLNAGTANEQSASVVISTKHKTGKKDNDPDESETEEKQTEKTQTASNTYTGTGSPHSNSNTPSTGKLTDSAGKKLACTEVSVDMDQDVVYDRNEMSEDSIALAKEEIEPGILRGAAGCAGILFGLGMLGRFVIFRKEV